jgi:thymidylate synthase ThyX
MQPGELMSEDDASLALHQWCCAGELAIAGAKKLSEVGASKEHANRVLEPFSKVNMVITATEWGNFFALRLHEHAQVEIRHLAQAIKAAMDASTPRELELGEWHLPFVQPDEMGMDDAPMISAARCARTSYRTHDGKHPNRNADVALAARLESDQHMSPFEHQAAVEGCDEWSGNFSGNWGQLRKDMEGR